MFQAQALIGSEIECANLIGHCADQFKINLETLLGVKQPSINNLQMINKAWPHK